MINYVALLRGIAPTNPNMRNEKLRAVFELLGFEQVQTVISSGNVLFKTQRRDVSKLEADIEAALFATLHFHSTTIIRSQKQLLEIAAHNPFAAFEQKPEWYTTVTFLQHAPTLQLQFPYQPPGKTYQLLGQCGNAIYCATNLAHNKTPDLMAWLERQYGKQLTTRTWQTVGRILQRWQQ